MNAEVYGSVCCPIELDADDPMARVLANSQPESIFNPERNSLRLYPARSALLKRAIVLPNSYELFLSPWLADSLFSYADMRVRRDWKRWFPGGHNAQPSIGSSKVINTINPRAFDGIRCLLNGKTKYIVKNHGDADNYWHWIFEWLPRLFVLRDASTSKARLREISLFVIGKPLNEFQTSWIKIVLGDNISITNLSAPLLCDQLIWVTPPFPAHHSRAVVDEIRKSIFESLDYKKISRSVIRPSRVYLLRGAARNGRRIKNEPELVEKLKALGFVAVSMDGLSVFEQARLFAYAKVIVGPHGSAFANMIYCAADCKIIELFGPGYLSGHDYSLAKVCGLHWEYIEGQASDNIPSFTSDFFIDCELLLRRLSNLSIG